MRMNSELKYLCYFFFSWLFFCKFHTFFIREEEEDKLVAAMLKKKGQLFHFSDFLTLHLIQTNTSCIDSYSFFFVRVSWTG